MEKNGKLPLLIKALLQPGVYDHPVSHCQLLETHISWVILAGDFVYKLKKPLDLGFLDFSTLDRRRHLCEEEVRLNRRLAPGIYLEVIAIGGTVDQPVLGAESGVMEYAVKMRRFEQRAQLDEMLERDELSGVHIDAFARMAADFHARVDVAGAGSEFGEPQQVWKPMAENFTQIREYVHKREWDETLSRVEHWSREEFERLEPILRRRKDQGFVRECHGDMHLRNLAWVDGQPIAFDCIEFNPFLRWIDVINEVAFLVMDLQERGEPRLAQRFLNAYLENTGDYDALVLMPLYLVYRALVRAKVAAIRSGQTQTSDVVRDQALDEYRAYLKLALGYTETGWLAVVLARGMSASGKTTLTGPLLEGLGAIRLRSDVERKRMFGMQAEEDGSAMPGGGIYTAEASEKTYDRLAGLAATILEAGYPVIIDAVCSLRSQRERFRKLAMDKGVPYLILAFTAPNRILEQRIAQRTGDASDADMSVLHQQLQSWQPLDEEEVEFELDVDTSNEVDSEQLLQRVRQQLY
ncbi:MAG: AAA family ATPase [Candidatus Thiodiazotropha sp.]